MSFATMWRELKYGAKNYKPLNVMLQYGKGQYVWDVYGKRYIDALAGYSALNHGHLHPRLIRAAQRQMCDITMTSRAFYNTMLGKYQEKMCTFFEYDRLLPMNTGVEAAETAVKLARRWGYVTKGITEDEAVVLFPYGNFWGRSIGAISASTDPSSYKQFGPFVPGFEKIPYDNITDLELILESNRNVVAFMLEPILGEAGVIVPSPTYLKHVKQLCERYNILFIADEIQTGLGRTGTITETAGQQVKPDLLVLAKSLGGGIMPVSCVMGSDDVVLTIKPGEHGSTFGGNPLGCAVAMEAIDVLHEEHLVERSKERGHQLKQGLEELRAYFPWLIKDVRGKGLMLAIEFRKDLNTYEFCTLLAEQGVLAKQTHEHTVRFSPPLVVSSEDIHDILIAVENVCKSYRSRYRARTQCPY